MNIEYYARRVELPVPVDEAFAWHERPGALERLIPPWQNVEVIGRTGGIRDGDRVELRQKVGPTSFRWLVEHCDYRPPHQFRDVALRGPFPHWKHTHRFESADEGTSRLEDEVEFTLPGGRLGRMLGDKTVRSQLRQTFRYRQRTLADDLAAHAKAAGRPPMRVAITGSSGLVGTPLRHFLTTGGHEVVRLVRGEARPGRGEIAWDPTDGSLDPTALEGITAVVHLAGESIAGGRWNDEKKRRIRESRVQGTHTLCEALARMERPPEVLVSASAIGIYGDRGDEVLDEHSVAGEGFLADVCRQWEAATEPAQQRGIRVVRLRFGMILSPRGGALATMLPVFKYGAGGQVGSGRQYMSWISVDDALGAIHHALVTEAMAGPANAVAPEPATNAEFTRTLARVLHRPAVAWMPALAARAGLGEMADSLLLASARVVPRRLQELDYSFRQPELELALWHLLGRAE